jgi:nitroreductase
MRTEDCPSVQKNMLLDVEQTEHFLRSRRSIRNYQEKNIEQEKLSKLIDIARYAPTGTNSQQLKWLVVNSREGVCDLTAKVIDMARYLIQQNDPIAEKYRFPGIVRAWEAGIDIITRGAPGLVIVHAPKQYMLAQVDTTIALTFLDLAAPSLGLGACWAGFFMIAAAQWPSLQESLALPEGNACFGAMMIGYPKYKYHRLPLRKEADITWR